MSSDQASADALCPPLRSQPFCAVVRFQSVVTFRFLRVVRGIWPVFLASVTFPISIARASTVQINFVNLAPVSIECGTASTPPCGIPTLEAFDTSQPDLGVGHAIADLHAG